VGEGIMANSATQCDPAVETITHDGAVLCTIIRAEPLPEVTTFYTPNEFNLQVGKIVYGAGKEIPRHTHRPVSRIVMGTSEVILVQKGSLILDVYDNGRNLVASRHMDQGDVVALVSGGHGFRLLADTVLVEVKQGPYSGVQEKDRF
jgi:hypothetical protein